MEVSELQRQGSTMAGNSYHGTEQSPRLRRAPSRASNQNAPPQFNWGSSSPYENGEGDDAGSPQDLKDLPMTMGLKRAIREVQQMKVPVVTSWQSWKRSKSKSLKRYNSDARGILAYITLWKRSLHKIGGHFGGGVQSYFVFLRFLVVLNFLSFLLIAGFVLIPSVVFRSIDSSNVTVGITGPNCTFYDPNPQGLVVFYTYFMHLLSGTGFMEYSYLFYGYYENTVAESSGFHYNLPLAYLLTAVFYFAFCLICIITRMGSAARVAVATGGGAAGSYSKIVFTGWDYGCQGDRATRLKQNSIRYQLEVDLEEERLLKKAKSLTLGQMVGLYSLRLVSNIVCLVLIGAAFYGIALATEFSQSINGETGIRGLVLEEVQQMKVPVVTSWQSWKRSKSKSLKRYNSDARGILAYITLWKRSLHKIGGHFGGGVQSYFVFLRFLVVLNFLSFLLIAGFVLIPSVVFRSIDSSNVTVGITGPNCTFYDPNPQGLVVFYTYFMHLLSGTGFMEYSYLFYGYYENTVAESSGFHYNLPLAYLLTAVFYFAFCLICIITRMGSAARVAVATGGGAAGSYSKIVFTGWDYGCQGDRATRLKQNSIRYQLEVDLEEERLLKKAKSLTLGQMVGLYSLRLVSNIVCLVLIGAAFYGIALATEFSQSINGETGIRGLVLEYLPSIVITAGNFLVPFICDQIALLEGYSPSTTVIVALLRSVFLRMVSLGVLLFTLWGQITCYDKGSKANCELCGYNYKEYPCWETRVGQEMYKLALFDFLTTIAVLILVEFPRRMVVDNCSGKLAQWVGRQEFLVPSNVLGLVYGQTVVWTGALFCPLLPVINTLKFIILFYCKKITLFSNCRPAVKTFRSTTSTFFFLVVLLFGWILALVSMIYSLAEIHPSMSCGPFRSLSMMWDIVPNTFRTLSQATQEFLFYTGSQAFSIPLCLFSCVVLCYVVAVTSVYGNSVALLRAQLKLEGRDKQFLVKQIAELSRKIGVPMDQR